MPRAANTLSGDTLSKDALAVYGDWHLYKTTLLGANPNIVDANKIYVGKWIIIPDQPTPATKTVVTSASEKAIAPNSCSCLDGGSLLPASFTGKRLIDTGTGSTTGSDINAGRNSGRSQDAGGERHCSTTDRRQSLPPTTKEARAKATKPKKISGYRFVIPHSHAFTSDGIPLIPMGLDLPTQVGISTKPTCRKNIPQ